MPSGEYDPDTAEPHWQRRWVDEETYAYPDDGVDPNTAFSIDTPPPTVSGSLHWGHVYGSILQDIVARFHRMYDSEVFYPFGYDDNGIASERLTERELDVRHQDFDRGTFQEKCRSVCAEYEADFTEKMQGVGLSIDWNNTYRTISPTVQRVSQLSFIDLYEKGREYRQEAPAIWCPECETAISQVETEDDERGSHFHDIEFGVVDDATDAASSSVDVTDSAAASASVPDAFTISTTRPELLPACVAVFVHPDDEANQPLVGQTAEVPLFGHEVPILADDRVDMETGSGVVMCCTFGDQTDIEWYQAHDLDLRVAIDESGHLTDVAEAYEGLHADAAREAIVDDLEDVGALLDRWEITHTVNVHERCGTSVEFLVTEQWYIEVLDKREEYLQAGREMRWFPEKMFTRYEHWVDGLQWDWLISRQRSSGIPFPVWYCGSCDREILAAKTDLPVDPLADDPPVDACPECGHDAFVPEDDVLDTWATSSLTPLINAGWDWDADPGDLSDGRPPAGARHHLFLAVPHRDQVLRTHRRGAVRVDDDQRDGPRREPREDVEVEGERRRSRRSVIGVPRRRRPVLGGRLGDRRRPSVPRKRTPRGREAHPQAVERLEARRVTRARSVPDATRRRTPRARPLAARRTRPRDRDPHEPTPEPRVLEGARRASQLLLEHVL